MLPINQLYAIKTTWNYWLLYLHFFNCTGTVLCCQMNVTLIYRMLICVGLHARTLTSTQLKKYVACSPSHDYTGSSLGSLWQDKGSICHISIPISMPRLYGDLRNTHIWILLSSSHDCLLAWSRSRINENHMRGSSLSLFLKMEWCEGKQRLRRIFPVELTDAMRMKLRNERWIFNSLIKPHNISANTLLNIEKNRLKTSIKTLSAGLLYGHNEIDGIGWFSHKV